MLAGARGEVMLNRRLVSFTKKIGGRFDEIIVKPFSSERFDKCRFRSPISDKFVNVLSEIKGDKPTVKRTLGNLLYGSLREIEQFRTFFLVFGFTEDSYQKNPSLPRGIWKVETKSSMGPLRKVHLVRIEEISELRAFCCHDLEHALQ